MAKIHEEIIIIKFSKLVKETETTSSVATDELLTSLGAVAEELAGSGIIVEIEKA